MGFQIEQLKRWHWCLIGLVVGLVLSYWHLPEVPRQVPTLSQDAFETALRHGLRRHAPPLTDLLVYPVRDGQQLVTGKRVLFGSGLGQPGHAMAFCIHAPYPYHLPGEAAPRADYSVGDRLAVAIAKRHAITYRYAWWGAPWLVFLFWTTGSVLLIGGLWPTLLAALTAAGFGRKPLPEDAYDLDRFRGDSQAARDAAADQAAADEAMAAALAEAKMTAGLKTATSANLAAASPPSVLQASLVEAPGASEETDPAKSFGGAFYPTTAHASQPIDPEHSSEEK